MLCKQNYFYIQPPLASPRIGRAGPAQQLQATPAPLTAPQHRPRPPPLTFAFSVVTKAARMNPPCPGPLPREAATNHTSSAAPSRGREARPNRERRPTKRPTGLAKRGRRHRKGSGPHRRSQTGGGSHLGPAGRARRVSSRCSARFEIANTARTSQCPRRPLAADSPAPSRKSALDWSV